MAHLRTSQERRPGVIPGLFATECGFQPIFDRFLFTVPLEAAALNRLSLNTFCVSFQQLEAYASTL